VFYTSEDRLTYTATFHRIGGLWRLRGVRETLQEFMVRAVVSVRSSFDLPPPPELLGLPTLPSSVLELIIRPIAGPSPPPEGPLHPARQ
jgi:hypothetical protein